ncbi:MAG: hypothetical protein PHG25_03590 [Candidatus Pacebacteria bacterium]|nr:hypothetical protein [Candidatus Paceibacterota bacterium]
MKKSVIAIVFVGLSLATFIIIHFGLKHGSTEFGSVALEQPATPSSESQPSASMSMVQDDQRALADVSSSPSSNGLLTLKLNPSFSKKLPSPEEAQKALAMNEEINKAQRSQ